MVWLAAGCLGINQRPTELSASLGKSCFGSHCRGIEWAIPVSARFYYTKKSHKGARCSGQLSSGSWGCLLCPRGDANRVLAAAEPPARTRLPGAEHHGALALGCCSPPSGRPSSHPDLLWPGEGVAQPRGFYPWRDRGSRVSPKVQLPRAPGEGPGKWLCPCRCGKA